jgi:histidyl-tRNA synthetase
MSAAPNIFPEVAVVVIGRNEGARLMASLSSLQATDARIVYVDSGSTDDSLQVARDAGAQVVDLDMREPFTAARARNAGFAALDPMPAFVQFIDGDCVLEADWIAKGLATMTAQDDIGIVTGWRAEIYPDAVKMKKQFNYANKKSIPFIVLIGSDELANNNYSLKNMTTGTQESMEFNQILDKLTNI